MSKRLVAVAALLLSMAMLSGCVVFKVLPSGEQVDLVGKMRVTVVICASGADNVPDPPEDHPGCLDDGNSDSVAFPFPGPGGPMQLLLAYRVPDGTEAPETVSATPEPAPPASGTIVGRRNASYEAALQAAVPAPPGSKWVGYLSDPYAFDDGDDGTPAQFATVQADFGLPPTDDGGPFVGSFAVRPVVGARAAGSTAFPTERPVDCGANEPHVSGETAREISRPSGRSIAARTSTTSTPAPARSASTRPPPGRASTRSTPTWPSRRATSGSSPETRRRARGRRWRCRSTCAGRGRCRRGWRRR